MLDNLKSDGRVRLILGPFNTGFTDSVNSDRVRM